jgi:hypothetical protein
VRCIGCDSGTGLQRLWVCEPFLLGLHFGIAFIAVDVSKTVFIGMGAGRESDYILFARRVKGKGRC